MTTRKMKHRFLVIIILLVSCDFLPKGENQVILENHSPDKLNKAVIFEKHGNATVNNSIQISIIPSEANLTSTQIGNILVADQIANSSEKSDLISLRWLDNQKVEIFYANSLKLIFANDSLIINNKNIKIEYLEKDRNQVNTVDSNSKTQPLLESKWEELIFEKGGCLGGDQYVSETSDKKANYNPKPLVFSGEIWSQLRTFNKYDLTELLINKVQDTSQTKVHVCPFFTATEGEMAIYALQKIHQVNWYDFEEFGEFKDRAITNSDDQPQIWLQNILKNGQQRSNLVRLFENLE